jgi:hypothetical protein
VIHRKRVVREPSRWSAGHPRCSECTILADLQVGYSSLAGTFVMRLCAPSRPRSGASSFDRGRALSRAGIASTASSGETPTLGRLWWNRVHTGSGWTRDGHVGVREGEGFYECDQFWKRGESDPAPGVESDSRHQHRLGALPFCPSPLDSRRFTTAS